VVLSADEVILFLEAISSLKSRAALTTAYAARLRASEVATLRVADVDSGRRIILVRHSKGGKDRNVMLSAQLLAILRTYWRLARTVFLFPGRDEDHAIDPTVLHAACRSAVKAAGLTKRTLHTLRHSFATHLLENGTTSGSFRSCSATAICRRRHAIRRWRPTPSGQRRARLIACRWR
jgi:integrase